MRTWISAVLVLGAAGAGAGELVAYRCADGTNAAAFYFDDGGAGRVHLGTAFGSRILPVVRSASGARYEDADIGLLWWTKGDEATLEIAGRPATTCRASD